MPMPPPMQSVARPFLALRRAISCSRVVSTRAPEAPIGWPIAIAPPLTLTIAGSQARSLLTASAWAAKASLASTRSRSLTDQPAFSSALRRGGDRPGAHDRRVDAGRRPGDDARHRREAAPLGLGGAHDDQAAAPSLRPEALPAVTVPSLEKAGLQFGHRVISRAGAGIFVVVDDDVALAGRYRERHDLVLEPAGLLRRLGLVLRGDGEAVLVLAADLPLFGDVLRRVAHVIAVEGVDEAVLQHRVDELQFAHLDPVRR